MTKKRFSIFFFTIVFSSILFSQVNSDLKLETSDTNDNLEKVYLYLRLAREIRAVDIEQAISYNRQALQLANIIQSDEARAAASELMGELFQMTNNFQPSINYFLISGKLYKSLGEKEKLAEVYGKLGLIYYKNNYNLESALFYYQESLNLGIELQNQNIIAHSYNRIGGVFLNQNEYDEANYYYREALSLWEQNRYDKGIAVALNNIGEIYRLKGSNNTALDYYNQSLVITKHINHKNLMAINYENIGLVKSNLGEFEDAFSYFNNSLSLYEEVGDLDRKVGLLIIMGDQYLNMNELTKAYQSYIKANRIAVKSNHWIHIADAAYGLSRTFNEMKNYKSSLKYFKIYAAYNDSVNQKKKNDRITEIQSRFKKDIQEKELKIAKNEIALHENQDKLNSLKLNLLILSVFFILIISFLILNKYRSQIRKERLIREKDTQLHKTQKELMEFEIQSKDSDLTNFALHLVQKNEILKHLQIELKNLPCGSDDETTKKLSDLNSAIKHNLSLKEDLEEFQQKLDSSYDDFFKRLRNKFPTLTRNEERLCAFLRLNLSSKEIATINNTSLKAAEMSRYRLRKKIGLNYNELLPEYLQRI